MKACVLRSSTCSWISLPQPALSPPLPRRALSPSVHSCLIGHSRAAYAWAASQASPEELAASGTALLPLPHRPSGTHTASIARAQILRCPRKPGAGKAKARPPREMSPSNVVPRSGSVPPRGTTSTFCCCCRHRRRCCCCPHAQRLRTKRAVQATFATILCLCVRLRGRGSPGASTSPPLSDKADPVLEQCATTCVAHAAAAAPRPLTPRCAPRTEAGRASCGLSLTARTMGCAPAWLTGRRERGAARGRSYDLSKRCRVWRRPRAALAPFKDRACGR